MHKTTTSTTVWQKGEKKKEFPLSSYHCIIAIIKIIATCFFDQIVQPDIAVLIVPITFVRKALQLSYILSR